MIVKNTAVKRIMGNSSFVVAFEKIVAISTGRNL